MLVRVLYTATHMHYYGMQLKPHYLMFCYNHIGYTI